jgi:hypothetical protein
LVWAASLRSPSAICMILHTEDMYCSGPMDFCMWISACQNWSITKTEGNLGQNSKNFSKSKKFITFEFVFSNTKEVLQNSQHKNYYNPFDSR